MKESFVQLKKDNKTVTVESYAKKLGLGTSSLKMIFSGKRQPTVHQTLTFARALRLTSAETSYLESLVLRETAKDTWQKAYYGKIIAEKKKQIKISTIHTSAKELISDSMTLPLLVFFMENKTTQINYQKLAKELKTTEKRIQDLITYFKKNEILMSQPDGQFHVAFDKLSHRIQQKNYQKAILKEASDRIETDYDKQTALFVNYAFSATDESLIQLQFDIKKLMAKYMSEIPADQSQKQIAQACFQIFPVISK